jgi:hypothetical protein
MIAMGNIEAAAWIILAACALVFVLLLVVLHWPEN